LGSGQNGLGIGSLGFDWSTIASYLGSPLASPWYATANVAVGFCLMMFVVSPLVAYGKDKALYNMSTFFAMSYGLGFATITATDCSCLVFTGRNIRVNMKTPGLNIITEYMIGYMYPGRPVANMCFKSDVHGSGLRNNHIRHCVSSDCMDANGEHP
ncbi:oligopeptide transporter 7, partial [Tanacetum coccineum]